MLKIISYVSTYARFYGLRDNKEGASLAEYALLLGLITGAVVLTIGVLSGAIGDAITGTSTLISGGEGEGESE